MADGKRSAMEGSDFKSEEKWDEVAHRSTDGGTGDAAMTRKTIIQNVKGNELTEKSVTLPDVDLDGLTNAKYHKAALGGSEAPMTYG